MAGLMARNWLARLMNRLTSGILSAAGSGSAMAPRSQKEDGETAEEAVVARTGSTPVGDPASSDAPVLLEFPPPPVTQRGLRRTSASYPSRARATVACPLQQPTAHAR